jgi:parallel beta-helix repeat protein
MSGFLVMVILLNVCFQHPGKHLKKIKEGRSMREEKDTQVGISGYSNGNRKEFPSPSTIGSRISRRPFLRHTQQRPSKTSQAVRLLLGTAVLLLALSLSQSVMAGQLRYICKDNTQAYSSDGCKGHGGVKSTTVHPLCGDGVLDPGEACDNGTRNSDAAPDSCRTDCRRPYCGDGVIDRGERCDDGSDNRRNLPNTCREDCKLPVCGDGIVDDGSHRATNTAFNEACDDGNSDDSDGCTVECRQCLPLGQMGNIEITTSTVLCPVQYQLDDYGDYGAIIIKASGVTLDCNGATLIGEGRGVGIVNYRSNDVMIKNCRVRGYDVGIRIQDARNVTLQGNTVCGNGHRDIELVDATDVHGYTPQTAGVSVCMDHEVAKPGIAEHAAMQHAPNTSGSKTATDHPHPGKNARTVNMKPVKVSPTAVASAPAKGQGRRPGAPTAEGEAQLLVRLAQQARWASRSAKVVFGSDRVPETGSVRVLKKGRLADGHVAVNLLSTQPDWKKGGYIQGVFPAVKIGGRTHFQSTVAMLKGANPAGAVSFDVLIQEGRRDTVVKNQPLQGGRRATLDLDLSRWRGKKVQLVLRVRRLKGARSLPAVWVNPMLVNVP